MRSSPEIGFAMLARGAQALAMLAAAVCVAWRFSMVEQGLFFVFLSFGALVQLCDFGLSYATLQMASRLAADGQFARLNTFRRDAAKLNLLLLSCGGLVIGVLGAVVISSRPDSAVEHAAWAAPWVAFVLAVGAAQLVNLELVLVEGARSAGLAWRQRALQETLGGTLLVAALLAGAGLWALPVYWGGRAAVAAVWLWRDRQHVRAANPGGAAGFSWRAEVWPFQWRIGVSGLSGFLIFQAFTPIVLLEQGSSVAGAFGMSLAAMNMLLMLTTAWPVSQAPRYVGLLATGRVVDLRRVFVRTLVGSTALAAVAAMAGLLLLHLLTRHHPALAGRLADLPTTAALLLAAIVHNAVQCYAVLLRAQHREPLLLPTVIGGVVTLCAIWLAARHGTPLDIALANLGCALVGIPIVLLLYRRFAARGFVPAPVP